MMNARLFLVHICAISILLIAPATSRAFEPGGTNYLVWQTGTGDPLDGNAIYNGSFGPDNGHWRPFLYDNLASTNPPITEPVAADQIDDICESGQKKISLVLWFTRDHAWIDAPPWNGYFGLVVNSSNGQLSTTIRDNIWNAVKLIASATRNGVPCFDELQFRFAPWDRAAPNNWAAWNDTWYGNNWGVISTTRALIEAAASTYAVGPLRRTYDLGAEQGGSTDGQNPRYTRTVWQMYHSTYGTSDTYGFSVATVGASGSYSGRIQSLLQQYDAVGVRPTEHALDVYDIDELDAALTTLSQFGEAGKPILIQETFFNDASFSNEIFASASDLGFEIRSIMQWPILEGSTVSFWSLIPQYANNLPVPHVMGADACATCSTGFVSGYGFVGNTCTVDLYSPSWQLLHSASVSCNDSLAIFPVPSSIRATYPGVRVALVNKFGRWNDPVYVSF